MKINKLNYEAFALEYLEGTLSLETAEAMEQFLLQHPDIKAELEEMRDFPVLIPKQIPFDNKSQLLKQPARDKILWLNPLRWSVAASILLAVMFLFFSKTRPIDPIIATATSDEIIDSTPNKSVLSKELEDAREIAVVENKVIKETTTLPRTEDATKASMKTKQEQLATFTKENKVIVDYASTAPQLVTTSAIQQSTIVANEKEEAQALAMSKQSMLSAPIVKTAISVATLPSKDIVLLELPKDKYDGTMHDLVEEVHTAIANTSERKSFRRFIGKLPGNGVKVSIIPSFFTD